MRQRMRQGRDATFTLLFMVMLTIAAGNTALQSVLPALGRSLGVRDAEVALAFSISALLWVLAAPFWAHRSHRHGRRAMIRLGLAGYAISLTLCGLFLTAGINRWIGGAAAFMLFILGRMIYGALGAAAPPAVQALVAARTTRKERTGALTLLASAFGLGTILGPALAPYLVLGHVGPLAIGLAGPAFVFALFGVAMLVAVTRRLPDDRHGGDDDGAHGAATAYPSIGGQSSGASVTAAVAAPATARIAFLDPRIRGWMIAGLVLAHAQAMTGQVIGFLVIDRLGLPPEQALGATGLVLMMGAGAALLAQWGLIPLLDLRPRALVLAGLALAAAGALLTGRATTLPAIATAYALASLGFGFVRPGFTAGSSLAVGAELQASVAGKVTSISGAGFVLGPSLGVALYGIAHPLPYTVAGAACALLLLLGWRGLTDAGPSTEA